MLLTNKMMLTDLEPNLMLLKKPLLMQKLLFLISEKNNQDYQESSVDFNPELMISQLKVLHVPDKLLIFKLELMLLREEILPLSLNKLKILLIRS